MFTIEEHHGQGAGRCNSAVDPHLSRSRFFGAAFVRSERSAITMVWANPWRLTIVAPAEPIWEVRLAEPPVTRLLNGIAAALPAPLWQRPTPSAVIARVAR